METIQFAAKARAAAQGIIFPAEVEILRDILSRFEQGQDPRNDGNVPHDTMAGAGVGDGVDKIFDLSAADNLGAYGLRPGSVKICLDGVVKGTDAGNGTFAANADLDEGCTVNYATGAVHVVLKAAPNEAAIVNVRSQRKIYDSGGPFTEQGATGISFSLATLGTGLTGADRDAYERAVSYLRNNPVRITRIHISAQTAPTLKKLRLLIRRATPFGLTEKNSIALGTLIHGESANETNVDVPADLVLDGYTFPVLRLEAAAAADEEVVVTMFAEAAAERRDSSSVLTTPAA